MENMTNHTEMNNQQDFNIPPEIQDQNGQMQADFLGKYPETCRNCGQAVSACEEKRALAFENIPDKSEEEAWEDLERADKERDLDNLRSAIETLQKTQRSLTYAELEIEFRKRSLKTHIIAYEKEISDTFKLMDLDGTLDRKYHIGFFFSAKAPRQSLQDGWPSTPEDNTERLKDAGCPVDSMIPKCSNCSELGHTAKNCKEERQEREKLEIKCVNCREIGHRARDCTQQRVDKFACRNCKQSGHTAKECPEPRSAEGVECKNCQQIGHFSKDCPNREPDICHNCKEEGHRARDCDKPRVERCRNCDEEGHQSRECPKPKDWTRVKCSNCGEVGHGRGRCKAPLKEDLNQENMPTTGKANGYGGYSDATPRIENGGGDKPAFAAVTTPETNDDVQW